MKSFKFLPVAALFCCYVFGSGGAIAAPPATISICPAGGGACSTIPMPASSYTNARSVDLTVRPVPVDPNGPSGSYCGWGQAIEGSNPESGPDGTYRTVSIPCQGYDTIPIDVFFIRGRQDILPDGSYVVSTSAHGCPAGYSSVAFSGYNGYNSATTFSCLKR